MQYWDQFLSQFDRWNVTDPIESQKGAPRDNKITMYDVIYMICLFWFSVAKFLSYDNLQFMKREDRGQQIRGMMLHTIILNTPTRRENKAPKNQNVNATSK